MLALIDYGASNIASVRNALHEIGEEPVLVDRPEALKDAARIVLPGVGAMPSALAGVREHGLEEALTEAVFDRGVPFLGICLGMQMMVEVGFEGGAALRAFGWLPGTVELIAGAPPEYTVPHMGWSELELRKVHPVFSGIRRDAAFYFCHSYAVFGAAPLATAPHGKAITAAIEVGPAIGLQFHPERSGPNGLRVLENFVHWTP